MRTGKGNQEEEEYGDEDYASKREGPSSSTVVHSNNNSNTAVSRDARENDKASAIRSKHSVTEQRRRSKINERFQILRELIPNSEQKKDTASFLLEVIEYVQYLQEKVQKCEGSYPGWSPEPTKLMPWRSNHWRVQSLTNHPLGIANGSGPGIPFPGKFEENTVTSTPGIGAEMQKPTVSDHGRGIACKSIDTQNELDEKRLPPVQLIPPLVQATQSNESPATRDEIGQNNDLVIEGGTISISSDYSHELLSSLTQALQNAGIDLSNARLSVQIDLGKRANQVLTHDASSNKSPLPSDIQGTTQPREQPCVEEESEHSHKRMKTK